MLKNGELGREAKELASWNCTVCVHGKAKIWKILGFVRDNQLIDKVNQLKLP